ncbi:DUF1588 domain-containing protein [Rubripirellula amarantea]|uniref:DUF1588 domain-containing protein n=1 Tax=Rubripirellula amarantea TaxID=2527999 RepID=UPI0013EEF6B3|nr:DUF1588 domain-containing protein [Rubripirellula amarantea]
MPSTFAAIGAEPAVADQSDDGHGSLTFDIEQLRNQFEDHCFGCHGDDAEEGGFAFEKLASGEYGNQTIDRWEAVWKNIRAQTMPPSEEEQPELQQRNQWIDFINREVFRLDPENIDPGKVVLRRLNRAEYKATVHQLTSMSFDTSEEFPADDTGYGFDTIGEVLHISPVLLEKYLSAAEQIVQKSIPLDGRTPLESRFWADHFHSDKPDGPKKSQRRLDGDTTFHMVETLKHPGRYRLEVEWELDNSWTTTKQEANVTLRWHTDDGEPTKLDEARLGFAYERGGKLVGDVEVGDKPVHISIELVTVCDDAKSTLPEQNQDVPYSFRLEYADFIGPLDSDLSAYRTGTRILFNGPPPGDADEEKLDAMTREVVERFALRAYRRPAGEKTIDRLVGIARKTRSEPGSSYERGIAMAVKLILASPRFIFRIEEPLGDDLVASVPDFFQKSSLGVPIDEYALATRLSYFLGSCPPNENLLNVAREGKLRENIDQELTRFFEADEWQLSQGIENFVGQWLLTRDVMDKPIEAKIVLAFRDNDFELDWRVRSAMKKETEMMFQHLIEEDRPVHELLNARYTFLNGPLAKFYGIDGVEGNDMRKVDLPEDSNRRGLLTHGSILMVTSNPTRTSPVKRGLFILENLLGTPSPPAPPNVPELEASKKGELSEASLRAVLELHRSDAACASCHSRMDPLGLALEHYNAMGQYREVELGMPGWRGRPASPDQPIDPRGELMTGEKFSSALELADILANQRRDDFYRCLAEKMLVYAIGRGLTHQDTLAVDQIVRDMHENDGSMRSLIRAIVTSVPFNYMPKPDAERVDLAGR